MNLKEQLAEALRSAQSIMQGAKDAGRPMTDDDRKAFTGHVEKAKELSAKIKAAEADEKSLAELNALGGNEPVLTNPSPARSLGEHFVKSAAYKELVARKGGQVNVTAPEYIPAKVAGDPTFTQGLGETMYGRVVPTPLNRPVVANLLSAGQLGTATSLTYFQMGAMQFADPNGFGFGSVAEGGAKPGMTFPASKITDALTKIAGWWKYSDEMVEDTPYIMSVIDSQLLVRLALAEEFQLLNANGVGNDMTGLLNRSGIQVVATGATGPGTPATETVVDRFAAFFTAMTDIYTGSFLTPDGVIVNPVDYQKLRLGQDANAQFYGTGPFYGEYGNGQVVQAAETSGVNQPGIWGLRTIVTPAMPVGSALVGAFQVAAQVFRKGGVRVDSTNANGTDFQNNLITMRAEERLLLACYQPLAFAKVTGL